MSELDEKERRIRERLRRVKERARCPEVKETLEYVLECRSKEYVLESPE